ncbi:rCG28597, partial [Rattus norvegicus]
MLKSKGCHPLRGMCQSRQLGLSPSSKLNVCNLLMEHAGEKGVGCIPKGRG